MSDSILAWHFVGDTLRDGRPVLPDGEWLVHEGNVVMCQSGLHASRDPFDALQFAPGPILCRVECRNIVAEESDKLVCRKRKIIERKDATDGLRYFARMQALSIAHLWDTPDVVFDYLMTGDDSLQAAAWAAAQAAAQAAAWAAAWDAAWTAAWAAAQAAVQAAAWDAARAAAQAAAWAAARDAAWAAAREDWNQLVNEAFGIGG